MEQESKPIKLTIKLLMTITLLAMLGCGGKPPIKVPSGAFTADRILSAPVGKQWDMVNDKGDITHFSIEAAPKDDACETGNHISMHITKNTAEAYWAAGYEGAETYFNLAIDPDGSYRGISDPNTVVLAPKSTIQWLKVPGIPTPYMIIPPYFERGHSYNNGPTFYHGWLLRGVITSKCVKDKNGVEDLGYIDWKSSFYESEVDTPVYKGWAIVSEQWENCNTGQFPGGCGAHEKWYFVPDIGLVEIDYGVGIIKRVEP